MIELKNVSKYYHSKDVTNLGLHNVSLRFDRNEIVAITGDSGSGKSTLLNVITKIDSFDEGEIYYKGNETSYFSVSDMDDFRKNKIGFIFQNYNILDSYTVLENVMLPLTLKGMSAKEAKEKALGLIEKVGLTDRVKARGTKLSGGEKQRCVIARALASDCEILACDEPTGNLDSKTGEDIINLIKEVAKDKLVLIVTHNFDQVKDIVTRKIRVADGEIVEDVKYSTVPDDPEEDLELDYVPLKKSICARVAKNNTLFTPRKTILLSSILMVICVATLFLFQTISASMGALMYNSVYTNNRSDRYVVYNNDHKALDTNLLAGLDYEVNTWTEDYELSYSVPSVSRENEMYYYSNRYSYTLEHGAEPTKDDEVVLVFPKVYRWDYEGIFNDEIIGKEITTMGATFKIAGIAYISDTYRTYICHCPKLERLAKTYLLIRNTVLKSNGSVAVISQKYDAKATSPSLVLPKSMENTTLEINGFNIYDLSFITKTYSDDVKAPVFVYNDNISEDYLPVFEASVYTSKSLVVKKLNKNFTVDECAKVTVESKLMLVLANIYSYISMAFACILLVIIFFITYLIIARVYSSRKRDYEILRTLGVTKSDMKHIVNYEVMGISIVVIIFSFILVALLVNTIPKLSELRQIKFVTALIYFAATYIFGYCIARRFNRKLFRFSVTKSMKGEGKHD